MPPSFSYQLLPFSENNKKLKKQDYSLKSHHPPNHKLLPQSIVNHNDSRLLLNSGQTGPDFRILPFKKGKPLVGSSSEELKWHLGWLSLSECKAYFEGSDGRRFGEDDFVYLGGRSEDDDAMYWAIDVSKAGEAVTESGSRRLCFVELSTLMVATDLGDLKGMGELAIAGNARALLLWHNTARLCGYCGSKTVSAEAGRRKQCSSESCKKRIYPRVDSVVIMLVIDKDNDRVLLNKLSRFVPRMWSCLSGFIEPGESLEEAVRRETWEETGVEVGEVVYHSSQPWPIGAGSMPCQLMVGFFAYAKTLEINVDKEELEDVRKALTFAEYKKAQLTAAAKVDKMCKGLEKGQNLSADFNVESRECAPMVIPGPSAIAHHLIASWVNQVSVNGVEVQKQAVSTGSLSNL